MSKIKMNLPRKVITQRLLIREAFSREVDLEIDLLAQDNCDIITSFYEAPERFITSDREKLEAIRQSIQQQNLRVYGIFRRGSPNNLIGQIIMDADRLRSPRIGFYIAKCNRRKGYASEAHKAMVSEVARNNPRIKTLWEEVVVGNNSSRNLLIGNGFQITGVRQSSIFGLDDKSLCLRRPLN